MDNKNEKVLLSIDNLKDKKSKIYFIVNDTKGNPKASVMYIYQMAEALKNNGFNPIILHEKPDYTGVSGWLGDWYMENIPHQSIDGQSLEISPDDFLVVPEVYGFIMEQIANLPCAKIVLAQSYSYALETLQPGQVWPQFGFFKCITTSEKQKEYISGIMRNVNFDVLTPYIPNFFQKNKLPPKPIIAIHTREHIDTMNIVKSFYLKFPQFRWIAFRDIHGIAQAELPNVLNNCCLSVWVDDISGFGTFPLESMSCGVPVIGKIPDLIPEWMTEENGVWTNDKISIVDKIAEFIQNWLEDGISDELYHKIDETSQNYKNKELFTNTICKLFDDYFKVRMESFENQINKVE